MHALRCAAETANHALEAKDAPHFPCAARQDVQPSQSAPVSLYQITECASGGDQAPHHETRPGAVLAWPPSAGGDAIMGNVVGIKNTAMHFTRETRSVDLAASGWQLIQHWLSPSIAELAFSVLHGQISWETHRLRLFGRWVDAPRLSCWIGDPGAVYRYSGRTFAPQPWPHALLPLRQRLREELGVDFNSVLANLYRDGRDAMGWHSDDEPELGPEPVIASLSLGAARRFVLRRRDDHAVKQALVLEPGSLLVMRGVSQRDWQHALPRTARPVGSRINLTFRRIVDAGV